MFDLRGEGRNFPVMIEVMGTGDNHGNGETEQPVDRLPALPVLGPVATGLQIRGRDEHVPDHLEIGQNALADGLHLVLADDEDKVIAPHMADKAALPGQFIDHIHGNAGHHEDDVIALGKAVAVIVRFEIIDIDIADAMAFAGINGTLDGAQDGGVAGQPAERIVVEYPHHSRIGKLDASPQLFRGKGTDQEIIHRIPLPVEAGQDLLFIENENHGDIAFLQTAINRVKQGKGMPAFPEILFHDQHVRRIFQDQ